MTRWIWLPAAAGLALALGVLSHPAAARGPGGTGGRAAHLERALATLELDEPRRHELLAVIDAARPTERALRRQLHDAHAALRALLQADDADEAAALARADEIGALHAELARHELRTLLQVRAGLSTAQRAQLAEALEKRDCGHRERRHAL